MISTETTEKPLDTSTITLELENIKLKQKLEILEKDNKSILKR